jgi:hypothetical protein
LYSGIINNRNGSHQSQSHSHLLYFILFRQCHILTKPLYTLSRVGVTIDGVWIGNWIYWTLTDPWLEVIITVSQIQALYSSLEHTQPVTEAARSRACTVFARSETGIVGSNHTQGIDVWCVCAFFCVCVVLLRADHPSKESYRLWMIKKLRNQPYAPKVEQAPKWRAKRKKKSTRLNLLSLLCLHQSSGNGYQRRTFPFLWDPELSPASATATLVWLTNQLSKLLYDYRIVLLITCRHVPSRKHRFPLLLHPIAVVDICLFAKPLLSNGCLWWLYSSCVE